MKKVVPVILCGGSGTRLWPLSRSNYPKQFLSLCGEKLSLFQQTVKRLDALVVNRSPSVEIQETVIVANESHRFLVLDQLHDIKKIADIILEPEGRNTAPSLTLAALHIQSKYGKDAVMLVLPADHFVANNIQFSQSIHTAISAVTKQSIVTLGIHPTAPETGYGYIKVNKPSKSVSFVERFVEKPDKAKAEKYLANGNYVWNAGIFVLSTETWLVSIERFNSPIYKNTIAAWTTHRLDIPFLRPDANLFAKVPSESIDYAVMEHASISDDIAVKMVKLESEWNDLGTWKAVLEQASDDSTATKGLVTEGDVLSIDSENSYIHSSGRLVATIGVKDLIVIETDDAVLVANKSQSQAVKKIVAVLENQNRNEQCLHRKVHRPWGWYDSIDEGERFKVKRICVKPHASLSLQKHHHRAEHWVVVKGTAEVTCGDEVTLFTENQSTYIPLGEVHRLRNPGTIPLEIIEVQSGSYLGEDDIVRIKDTYGRI